jgi:hypothetical protein
MKNLKIEIGMLAVRYGLPKPIAGVADGIHQRGCVKSAGSFRN